MDFDELTTDIASRVVIQAMTLQRISLRGLAGEIDLESLTEYHAEEVARCIDTKQIADDLTTALKQVNHVVELKLKTTTTQRRRYMAHTDINFKTKALKEAVKAGKQVTICQPEVVRTTDSGLP